MYFTVHPFLCTPYTVHTFVPYIRSYYPYLRIFPIQLAPLVSFRFTLDLQLSCLCNDILTRSNYQQVRNLATSILLLSVIRSLARIRLDPGIRKSTHLTRRYQRPEILLARRSLKITTLPNQKIPRFVEEFQRDVDLVLPQKIPSRMRTMLQYTKQKRTIGRSQLPLR